MDQNTANKSSKFVKLATHN